MIKNIIFDLGGVLFDWDPRYIYKDLMQTEDEVNHFLGMQGIKFESPEQLRDQLQTLALI